MQFIILIIVLILVIITNIKIVPQSKTATPEKVETVAKDSVQTKSTTVNK